MYRSNEDGTEHHPKQRRHPAPHDGDGRTHDRARAGNGREVVPEDNRFTGRHIVHPILQPFTGAHRVGRESEYFTAQPTAIGVVGDDKADSGQERDEECFHGNRDEHASGKQA